MIYGLILSLVPGMIQRPNSEKSSTKEVFSWNTLLAVGHVSNTHSDLETSIINL
jgi:hypothetical protein